jgi:hypothetical protein
MAEPVTQRKTWPTVEDQRGLECRYCGCKDFRVIYTRDRIGGIRRKRECRNCGKAIWTMEGQPAV